MCTALSLPLSLPPSIAPSLPCPYKRKLSFASLSPCEVASCCSGLGPSQTCRWTCAHQARHIPGASESGKATDHSSAPDWETSSSGLPAQTQRCWWGWVGGEEFAPDFQVNLSIILFIIASVSGGATGCCLVPRPGARIPPRARLQGGAPVLLMHGRFHADDVSRARIFSSLLHYLVCIPTVADRLICPSHQHRVTPQHTPTADQCAGPKTEEVICTRRWVSSPCEGEGGTGRGRKTGELQGRQRTSD